MISKSKKLQGKKINRSMVKQRGIKGRNTTKLKDDMVSIYLSMITLNNNIFNSLVKRCK